jgi:hypothetical protein
MAPHGLTFGEHCVDKEKELKQMSNLLEKQIYSENQRNVHEKCGLAVSWVTPRFYSIAEIDEFHHFNIHRVLSHGI